MQNLTKTYAFNLHSCYNDGCNLHGLKFLCIFVFMWICSLSHVYELFILKWELLCNINLLVIKLYSFLWLNHGWVIACLHCWFGHSSAVGWLHVGPWIIYWRLVVCKLRRPLSTHRNFSSLSGCFYACCSWTFRVMPDVVWIFLRLLYAHHACITRVCCSYFWSRTPWHWLNVEGTLCIEGGRFRVLHRSIVKSTCMLSFQILPPKFLVPQSTLFAPS